MHGELDDILSGKDPEPIEQPAQPEVEAKGETGENTAEATPPAAAAPPAAEPAKDGPEKGEMVPVAALIAERKARQSVERQLQQHNQPDPAKVQAEIARDPQGYVDTRLREHGARQSAAMVEAQHPDFREKLAIFMEEAERNPILAAEIEDHPHPALYAYQQAQKILEHRELQKSGSLDEVKRKAFEEGKAAALAELKQQKDAKAAAAAAIPPDLAGARGAKVSDEPAFEPLESILKR